VTRGRRVLLARHEHRAGAGGEVDDHIAPAVADALDHLAIKFEFHAGASGRRIAHMDMDDRGASLGGVDRLLRNLHRGDRDRRIVATDRRAAGDRAGEDGRWHGASAVLLRGL